MLNSNYKIPIHIQISSLQKSTRLGAIAYFFIPITLIATIPTKDLTTPIILYLFLWLLTTSVRILLTVVQTDNNKDREKKWLVTFYTSASIQSLLLAALSPLLFQNYGIYSFQGFIGGLTVFSFATISAIAFAIVPTFANIYSGIAILAMGISLSYYGNTMQESIALFGGALLFYIISSLFIQSLYRKYLNLEILVSSMKLKEESIREFINSLPGIVSIFDENLQYYDCNEQLLELLNMSKEDLIGKPLGFIYHNSQFAEKIETFYNSQHKIENFQLEELNEATQEKKHYFGVLTKNQLVNGATQISALSIDISDLKKKERELEIKKIELIESEKLVTLGELASGLSHEVNNPMAIISGRVQVLLRKIAMNEYEPENFKIGLNKILETTIRVKRIVHSLKIISKENVGLNIAEYTTQDILDPLMALYGHRLFFSGVELIIDNQFQSTIVKCSLAELSQVVLHLLKNAVDALKDNTEKWLRIELHKENNKLQIWFIDSGNGIPLAIQKKMFEPFFTTKSNNNGTGVGLASARDMMRKQGGDLFYNNTLSNTCFVIELSISNTLGLADPENPSTEHSNTKLNSQSA